MSDIAEGSSSLEQSTLTLSSSALRQTGRGLRVNCDFSVQTRPQGLRQLAPVIIISHGFGDIESSFAFIAEHLASHGFVVLVPKHVGSDLSSRENFLQGFTNTILSPSKFVNRPEETSFLIDELERLATTSPEWADQLNLEQIGVLGDSLGGSTALALAGADISATFPQAELVPFAGPTGRSEAVTALAAGEVDGFASDGILSTL